MGFLFKKLCFVLIMCFSSAAYADLLSPLNVEFGLEFPTYFGVHAKVSQNENFYTRFGVGVVHSVTLKTPLAAQLMNMTSSLKENEMSLVVDTLANSVYLGLSFGIRQSSRAGSYLELGYSNIFRFEPKGIEVKFIQDTLGREFTSNEVSYDVKATLHNGTLHAGYMFPLSKHVSLSAELGVIKPLYAQVSLDYKDSKETTKLAEKEDSKKIKDLVRSLWMVTGALWVSVTF